MFPLPTEPSLLLNAGFVLLALVMVAGLALVLRSQIVLAIGGIWMIATGTLGYTCLLADFSEVPPRAFFLLVPTLIAVIALASSKVGRRLAGLPLALVIGFQVFRIPVELLIHRAVEEGISPPQMSWNGMNFDILTGISALILSPFSQRLPKWVLHLWNLIGLGLVLWVVGVAILSFPTSFQRIHPDNVWVAHFPFIWLPTILVAIAILGHLVLFRKLVFSEDKLYDTSYANAKCQARNATS